MAAFSVGLLYIVKGPVVVWWFQSGATWAGSVLCAEWQGEQTPLRVFHTVNSELVDMSWGEPSTPLLTAAFEILGIARAAPIRRRFSFFIGFVLARAFCFGFSTAQVARARGAPRFRNA